MDLLHCRGTVNWGKRVDILVLAPYLSSGKKKLFLFSVSFSNVSKNQFRLQVVYSPSSCGLLYARRTACSHTAQPNHCHLPRPCFGWPHFLKLGRWQPERRLSQSWHQNYGTLFLGISFCHYLLTACIELFVLSDVKSMISPSYLIF